MVAGGCAGSSTQKKEAAPPATAEQPAKGGTLVMHIPSEPSCADWLASCAQVFAAFLSMARPTVPRPLDFVDGKYRATPLLAGEPALVAGPPQRLTYRLNPRAVWSDGQPITSSDLRYTWEQGASGPSVTTTTGFDKIAAVDDTDPATAVVTFKESYAAWRSLFPTILPKHLLEGKDRKAEMKDGYSWSGGPWIIDRWTKGQEIKLVPNPAYWDKKPNLDAVVWKIIPDSAAALAAYKSGQVSVLSALPAEVTAAEVRSLPDTKFDVSPAFGISYVNFNTTKAPLNSVAVRQSLAYASDRDAIVAQTTGLLKPDAKAIGSFMTPAYGPWYVDSYGRYRHDSAKVDEVMRGDGWAKGPDGVWVKANQRAEFELLSPSSNRTSDLVVQILQSQWKAAGFDVTLAQSTFNALSDRQAKGLFQASLAGFAFSNSLDDPGRCIFFCSRNIPSPANANSGFNVSLISSPALDEAWDKVGSEIDDVKRREAVKRANDLTADLVPALPIAPSVVPLVHNTTKLAGPVTNNVPSPYYNLNEWYCRGGTC